MLELSAKERAVADEKARADFYFYSRYMLLQARGVKWQRAAHHHIICDALMRVFRGECKRLIINIPPRYSKTELVSKFVSFALGHHPDAEFMYLSYSVTLAKEKTADILADVRHSAYQQIFPDVELTKDAEGHWKTSRRGAVYAAGTEGTVTGFGAGKMRDGFGGAMIVDDPLKPDEAFSDVSRESVWRNFQNTLEHRLNWANTPIILIMQRLHEKDPSGYLLAGANGEAWDHVCLPAIQPDGTALWPEKHSLETLERMKEADPYTFSGQYLQQPVPLGGGFFREASFLIKGEEGRLVPIERMKYVDCVFAVIDTAAKAGKAHDGLAVGYFALCLRGQVSVPLQILDWDYMQLEGALLETWLPTVFQRLETLAKEMVAVGGSAGCWIEDKSSGIVLLQQATNRGWKVHPINTKLTSLGKIGRGLNVSTYISEGRMKFTREAYEKQVTFKGVTKNHMWTQLMAFSPSVKENEQDDLFDVATYAAALALGNSEGF